MMSLCSLRYVVFTGLISLFAFSGSAMADPIMIDFTQHLVRRTTSTTIDLGDGLTLTIDNPSGLDRFNGFHIINVGLRIDGGLSPHIDLTFSKPVQINSFTTGEVTGRKVGDSFTLSQGGITSSSGSLQADLGTYNFSNPNATFAADTPINWTTATPTPIGTYALSGMTVLAVPEPALPLVLSALSLGFVLRRKRSATTP